MNIIGNKIIELEEINSTNDYAAALLLNDKQPDGTIVLAQHQSHGKGQGKNIWESAKGKNLLMSVVLNQLNLKATDQFFISEMTAISIVSAIKELYEIDLIIKWPNDIYFNNKKIGGILIRNSIGEGIIKHSIIGIGININQEEFPENIPNPSSLSLILQRKLDKEAIFYSLIQTLNDNYLRLLSSDFEYFKKEFEKNLIGFNKEMQFIDNKGKSFEAIILGVKESGELLIKIRNEIKSFSHGEIKLVLN